MGRRKPLNIATVGYFTGQMPSCHPPNIVEALKTYYKLERY